MRSKRILRVRTLHPALEHELARYVLEARRSASLKELNILVPAHDLGRHLQHTLARWIGAAFNVRPLTFPELAKALVFERVIESKRLPLQTIVEFLIARKAVRVTLGVGTYFAPIRDFPSTPRAILSSLTDLKKADISAERLAGGVGSSKLMELAGTYAEAERLKTEARSFDESDLLAMAAEMAPTSPLLKGALAICLYGFPDLNQLERRLFAACIEGRQAHAFVPDDVAGYAAPLVEWLKSLGFEREEHSDERRAISAGVTFVSAPGVAHEVQEIARQILTHAAAGTRFSDVAVFLRNPAEYERTIRDGFDAAGIPHTFLEGIAAAEMPAGRLLRLLMRIRLGDYPRPDTMEFLGLAPLHPRLLKEHPEASPADWDRYSREAGIMKGREHWRRLPDLRRRIEWRVGRIEKEPEGAPDEATLAILRRDLASLRVFERVVNLLLKRLASIPDQATVGEMMGGLIRALVSVAHLRADDRAIVRTLADVAGQAAADEVVSLETFGTLLEDLLTERMPSSTGSRSGGVVVSTLSAALGLPFKIVFIPGLVERSFPPPPRQDPILLDEEREALNAALGTDLKTRDRRAAEEQFYFHHALRAASEAVILTYPRLDAATGHVRVPSHFLLQVAEEKTGEPVDYAKLEKLTTRIPLSRFESPVPLTAGEWDLSGSVRALADGQPARLAGLPGLPMIVRGTTAEAHRWGKRTFTDYDGLLGEAVAVPDTLSATHLETYGTCPFRFLGSRILGVRIIEEPEAVTTLTPLDRGSIIHEILESFLSNLVRDGLLPFDRARLAEYRSRLDQTARRVFRDFERSGAVGYPFMWKVEQEHILTDLQGWLSIEVGEAEGFVPAFFEARFGPSRWGVSTPGSTGKPLELTPGTHPIRLTGFVDRIDLHPGGRARIIDYKSGAVYNMRPNLFRGGENLQLPIYLLAADQMLRDNGRSHGAEEAQYFYVTSKGRFRRIGFTRAALDQRRTEFDTILRTMTEGIASGIFPQNPSPENCRYCDYVAVCGHGRTALVERKAGDPAVEALQAMWEIK
jgi:ATP-dependent helicase/DNAse subunit B